MEFLYTLTLIDRLFIQSNWSSEDEAIVGRHFQYLKELQEKGVLVLAGKTAGLDTNTRGLVIFMAKSFEEALNIMNNDPSIKEGIMTGVLQEYNIALLNNEYKK